MTFTFTFDGHDVPAEDGQTIAAALLASGVRTWRTTRLDARPRGLFCGIGACHDCLLTVNGTPHLRACLTEARPADHIHPDRPPLPAQTGTSARPDVPARPVGALAPVEPTGGGDVPAQG
ncbi:(2Fe-2S)-binding protein, partial [Actinocorallia lasiicapitis]